MGNLYNLPTLSKSLCMPTISGLNNFKITPPLPPVDVRSSTQTARGEEIEMTPLDVTGQYLGREKMDSGLKKRGEAKMAGDVVEAQKEVETGHADGGWALRKASRGALTIDTKKAEQHRRREDLPKLKK